MENPIDGGNLVAAIMEAANTRFALDVSSPEVQKILNLAPTGLADKSVVRLQRMCTATPFWRTVLVSVISSVDAINLLQQWAAAVKGDLLDPESSDLYLMAVINDPERSLETCINMEADEQFCRKYIRRPGETPEEFIGRTFLGSIAGETGGQDISDPLLAALAATGAGHDWFTPAMQRHWHAGLLSGKTGAELIDLLFIPENRENAES